MKPTRTAAMSRPIDFVQQGQRRTLFLIRSEVFLVMFLCGYATFLFVAMLPQGMIWGQ